MKKVSDVLEDVFELQDEVTSCMAVTIGSSIKFAEIGRANIKSTNNLDAYDLFLRGLSKYRQWTRADNDMAIVSARGDRTRSRYALAKAFLAFNHVTRWNQGWGEADDREKALSLAREAIADDANDPAVVRWAEHTLGRTHSCLLGGI